MDLERIADWLGGLQPALERVANLPAWAAPRAIAGRLQIGCCQGRPPVREHGLVRLPCLSHLTWRDLVQLRGLGITEITIVWSAERCAACPQGMEQLPELGAPVTVASDFCPAAPSSQACQEVDQERRTLLFAPLDRLRRKEAPTQAATNSEAAPDEAQLLRQSIATLDPDTPLPLRRRTVGIGCTFCGACGQTCSAYQVTGGTVTWWPDRCHECGLCQRVCPAGVIGQGHRVKAGQWGEALVLAQSAERTCACGEHFYNNDPAKRCLRCELLGDEGDGDGPRYF